LADKGYTFSNAVAIAKANELEFKNIFYFIMWARSPDKKFVSVPPALVAVGLL